MKTLAEQQADLMAALAGHAPPPVGFDAARLEASAHALLHKRSRSAAQAWPAVAELLGANFASTFADYAAERALPADGGPLADGRGFVQWLQSRRPLDDRIRRQALLTDARFASTGSGLRPRHGPSLRAAWWPESGRWAIVLRWPGRRERHVAFKAPWR